MSGGEIVQIKVGRFMAGVVGLQECIEDLAEHSSGLSNDEVKRIMIERLGKTNYIPSSAMEEYGRAFLREYCRARGLPFEEDAPEGLEIKVLGQGCAQCDSLERTVMQILEEIRLPANLEHVRDIKTIAQMGVMVVPALMIGGKVVSTGTVPPARKIRQWILEAASAVR
ncbi:MAG: thioredoxin family protein [Desulfobacteraceae bacterium]|nr:thioredoxin family protein [Desulfobacteraceae bacterium]